MLQHNVPLNLCYVVCNLVEVQPVVSTKESVTLTCVVSGFDTNLPTIDYDWLFNGSLIPHSHDQLTDPSSLHSKDALTNNARYNVSLLDGELTLTIQQPGEESDLLFS